MIMPTRRTNFSTSSNSDDPADLTSLCTMRAMKFATKCRAQQNNKRIGRQYILACVAAVIATVCTQHVQLVAGAQQNQQPNPMDKEHCQRSTINITKPLTIVAHLDEPFVMLSDKHQQLQNRNNKYNVAKKASEQQNINEINKNKQARAMNRANNNNSPYQDPRQTYNTIVEEDENSDDPYNEQQQQQQKRIVNNADLTMDDLKGFSIDVLREIERRFGVNMRVRMLSDIELERWPDKRALVENKMFSRSVDMSANILTRKDNRRQNLPPIMNGQVKAVLKDLRGLPRIENLTMLVDIARTAKDEPQQLDWKFMAVDGSEAWRYLKTSKSNDKRELMRKIATDRYSRALPANRTDGIAFVRNSSLAQPVVFFDESIMADYYANKYDDVYTIDIDTIDDDDVEYVFGTAFDMRDDVKRNLTCIILDLQSRGTFKKLKQKWWKPEAAMMRSHDSGAVAALPMQRLWFALSASVLIIHSLLFSVLKW